MTVPGSRRVPSLPRWRWRVRIGPHAVSPRWSISGQEVEVTALRAQDARLAAVRRAHGEAGVPACWRYVHHSMGHAVAVAVVEEAPR